MRGGGWALGGIYERMEDEGKGAGAEGRRGHITTTEGWIQALFVGGGGRRR